MEGFKITCLKCGKEQVIDGGNVKYNNLKEMLIFGTNDGDVVIECRSCENESDID